MDDDGMSKQNYYVHSGDANLVEGIDRMERIEVMRGYTSWNR
jgi:hypothetical protein